MELSRDRLRAGRRRLGDLGEELVVALGGADLVDQQLETLPLLERVQHPAELPDLLELVPIEQQLLVAGARRPHVDGRGDPPPRQPPVEPQPPVVPAPLLPQRNPPPPRPPPHRARAAPSHRTPP